MAGRLSFSEHEEAKRIAGELVAMHGENPISLASTAEQSFFANVIRTFNASYIPKCEWDAMVGKDLEQKYHYHKHRRSND